MSQKCDVHFLLHGADKPSADEIRSTLTSLEADWGVAPKEVKCYRFSDPDVVGDTNNAPYDGYAPGEVVRISEGHAKDFKGWQQMIRDNHPNIAKAVLGFTEDHPAAYCMIHEYGHVLQGAVYGEFQPWDKAAGVVAAVGLAAAGTLPPFPDVDPWLMPHDVAQVVTMSWGLGAIPQRDMQKLVDDLSPYATANPAELLAEAFARDRLYPGTSKTATAIMQLVRHDFEKKFGRPAPAIAA